MTKMKPLMQKMMAERFKMTYHRETRECRIRYGGPPRAG